MGNSSRDNELIFQLLYASMNENLIEFKEAFEADYPGTEFICDFVGLRMFHR